MKDRLTRFFERNPRLKESAIVLGLATLGAGYYVGDCARDNLQRSREEAMVEQAREEGAAQERARLGLPALTTKKSEHDKNATLGGTAPAPGR